MPLLYECYPTRDFRVLPVSNIITRACLAPIFFDGMYEYNTIPHRFRNAARHFDGGQTDTATPTGRGSKLYALNMYAMTFGRAKPRTESLEIELAKRAAKKAAYYAKAASKRRETWAQKRQKT
jgi:hypothetical protein